MASLCRVGESLRGESRRSFRAFAVVPAMIGLWAGWSVVPNPVASYSAPDVGADAVVTGVVTQDGAPGGELDVFLLAWPNQEVLTDLGDGEEVPTKLLAHEVTDAEGRFVAAVDPATVGPMHTGDEGQVDIELVIADSSREILWNFTATRAGSGTGLGTWGNPRIDPVVLAAAAEEGVGPVHLTVEFGEVATLVERGNGPEQWVGSDGFTPLGSGSAADAFKALPIGPRRGDLGARPSASAPVCLWRATSTYDNSRTERFINSIGTVQGKPVVTQETSSSHSLGVAFKGSGSSASWSQSGEITKSTGVKASNHKGYTVSVRNRVNYRLYSLSCVPNVTYQEYRPHSYHSLNDSVVSISRPNWRSNCGGIQTNGSIEKTKGTNVKFSTGVDLKVMNVSAQAQFTSRTTITWNFSGSGARPCGSNSLGYVSAPQAGAFVP